MGAKLPRLAAFQAFWLLVVGFCLFVSSASAALNPRSTARPDFWDLDGPVYATLATNGILYVGGEFSYAARPGSRLLAIDRYTGEIDASFPSIQGAGIYTLLDDGAGGWFVGGEFDRVGSIPATNLVHILADNSLDPGFLPGPDAAVRALAYDGTNVFFGGDFTHVGGISRGRAAAWNINLGQLSSWAPNANGSVSAIALSDGVVYLGGSFTTIGGLPRRNIAAVAYDSGSASAWRPDADGAVLSLALVEEKLFAGGFFNRIGGQLRNGLAALDVHSTNALPWDPNPAGGKVTSVRATCDTVYVGGYFTNIAGVSRIRAASLDANSGQATAWDPALDLNYSANLKSYLLALEISGNEVYLAGQYRVGANRDLGRFNAQTGQLLPWNPNIDGGVSAIAISGRKVLAGVINPPGGISRRNLAAFDERTGRALDWNPDPDGPVRAFTLANQRLIIGGDFLYVGDNARTRLAAVDLTDGSVDTNWNASANNTVFALASDSQHLFAGGSFTSVNGLTRQRLCVLDPATGQPLAGWTAPADGSIYALTMADGVLYLGGNFVSIASIPRNHVAALDAGSAVLQPWDPGADGTVRALTIDTGLVYLGGSFNHVGAQTRNFAAQVPVWSSIPTSWHPDADDEVRAITVLGDKIFLGGHFRHISGQARFGLAAVNSLGQLLSFDSSRSPDTRVESLSGGMSLYAGTESPVRLANSSRQWLAAFADIDAPTLLDPLASIEAVPGQDVQFVASVGGQPPISYQWSFNGVPLPSATNSSLSLSSTAVAQSGEYELLATNASGSITAHAALTVLQPPIIVTPPSPHTLTSGDTLTLTVVASGSPPPQFQWRLNGANIPGAVYPTLIISNIPAAQSGNYQVLVANRIGLVASDVVPISVSAPGIGFADNRAARGTITTASGVGVGSNAGATVESNEPNHAGKPGGHSIWLSWIPPATGIANLNTRGSDFDTLLAVYKSTGPSNLVSIASDDDSAGFGGSRVTLNVNAGSEYLIAVDGAYGSIGRVVLSWDLETNPTPIPVIGSQPQSHSAAIGESVTFSVAATSSSALTYQWLFGCREIPNATNASLIVPNVRYRDVGSYRVIIMNSSSRFAQSDEATLELGPRADIVSHDKLEDLFLAGTNGPGAMAALSSGGFLLVSMGSIDSQILNNTGGSTQPGEPSHCGVLGGASKWIGLRPTDPGVIVIDTIGSRIDTVVAVYTGSNPLNLQEVACDDNGAPDRVRSLLHFDAVAGTDYLVAADGVNGAQGTIFLNWKLGLPPTILSTQGTNFINPSEPLTLSVQTGPSNSPTTYQWRSNGTNIPAATAASVTLGLLPPGTVATYSVIVGNAFGVRTQEISRVIVRKPSLNPQSVLVNGHFRIWFPQDQSQNFELEGSSDLENWFWIESYPSPNNPNNFRDFPIDGPFNFFRAVPD